MSGKLCNTIPVIASSTNYWIIRSGVESKYFEEFAMRDIIGLGWDRISDLESIKRMTDFTSLKNTVLEKYPEISDSYKNVSRKTSDISGKIFNFVNELKIGDIIVTPGKEDVLIGKIISDPFLYTERIIYSSNKNMSYEEKLIGELNKARKVEWLERIERKNLESNLKLIMGVVHGIAHIKTPQVITEINRSIYNFYQIEDKDAHSIFKINTQEQIDFEKYAFFIKSLHDIYNILKVDFNDEKLYIKTNVQSTGPIEIIGPVRLVVQIVSALRAFIKNEDSALQEIEDVSSKEKIIAYKEENIVEHDYNDYNFPNRCTF